MDQQGHNSRFGGDNFYRGRKWRRKRKQVLEHYRHECLMCKTRGILSPATIVHHDLPRENHPELEYAMFKPDGTPQLIPLCFSCHEIVENKRHKRGNYRRKKRRRPLTEEWW